MTDTGQVPGEGLPENAVGEAVPQPHADLPGQTNQHPVPSWGADPLAPHDALAYSFPEGDAGPGTALDEDEDLLLMPGVQGSWSDPQPVPPQPPVALAPSGAAQGPDGVDSGAFGHLGERQPQHARSVPVPGYQEAAVAPAASFDEASEMPRAAERPAPPRRPLHLGPPLPDTSSGGVSVRSLADRGPARHGAQAPAPVRVHGPQATGPEYLDAPREENAAIPPQPAAPQTSEASEPTPGHGVPAAGSAWPAAPAEPLSPAPVLSVPFPVTADVITGPVAVQAAVPHSAGPVAGLIPAQADERAEAPPSGPEHQAPVEAAAPETPAAEAGQAVPLLPGAPAATTPEAADPAVTDGGRTQGTAPAEVRAQAPAEVRFATPDATVTPDVTVTPGAAGAGQPTAPVAPVAVSAPEGLPVEVPAAVAPTEPGVQAAAAEPAAAVPAEVTAEAAPAAHEPSAGVPVVPVAQHGPEAASDAETGPEPLPAAETEAAADLPVEADDGAPAPETATPAPETATPGAPDAPREAEETASEDGASLDGSAPDGPVRPTTPAADGYDVAVRDAVHRVIRERRDIRNGFRPDPIPHEVLIRVLEAAHTAPSVGHSQPWDFVVIRSAKTRERMHELAMEQREAYAKSLPKARAKQFRELKIEAILDTPVNIVVTADPTRGGRHTLGRHTQPQMAPYSSALAVENLWLAARAEGLGVGWVSFFDERQMVRELGLPDHLEVVAYLCVGYVDEFPEEPELMQAGWSQRRPLSWVVHEEEYGNRALPGEEPHDLLDETLRGIRPLDAKALGEAWERQKRMTKPSGALGVLEIISAQLSGLSRMCPPPIPEPAAVAIFAGDHGVHAQGVTPWPQEVTAQMVANFLGGGAVCNAFANQVGAEVCVVDVGVASELPSTPGLLPRKVRPGTDDFTAGPAMSRDEALRAIEVGIETARDLVAAGNKALLTGEMGIANTTTSAALISVFTGVDPADVTGRGTGINEETHARKVDVVRRALDLHRPDPADPIGVLAAIGGLEHAAMTGLLLGAAALRTPVILDGVSAGAAALVARAIAPEVLAACIAGHRSAEPGHSAALTKLGLRPLIDLDLRLGEGTGALLALPLVQCAARAMHEVATFDTAGVTEKS